MAVTRCMLDVGHYVLLTGQQQDAALLWDPYYLEKPIRKKTIAVVEDHPYEYNRRVAFAQMNSEGKGMYSLGPVEKRECLLVWNTAKAQRSG